VENDEGWEEVIRIPSPRNPFQKKTKVEIKREHKGDEMFILCRSDGVRKRTGPSGTSKRGGFCRIWRS